MKSKLLLLFMGMLVSWTGLSQTMNFGFRREIDKVDSSGWYSIPLPDQIFKNINAQFSDLRIYSISGGDTIESPYLLKINQPQESEESVDLTAVNQSRKDKIRYFTFALPPGIEVNYLNLAFVETNFDGFVKLEGSNDQREWFEIEKHQRIISIENERINFASSTLHFNLQNFHYLRIQVEADRLLSLKQASFKKRIIIPGRLQLVNLGWKETDDKKLKQTTIAINLRDYQPVVKLSIGTSESKDFYRVFRLERLADSSKTQKGWEYFYETVTQGVLTSVNANSFSFGYTMAKKLRLIIDQGDNAFLKIKNIKLFSPAVDLVAHLEPADHFLYYGNTRIGAPSYDIVHFKDKMRSVFASVNVKGEESLTKPEEKVSPLIKNKMWLWILMAAIIGVLGFFTLRMLKGK